jgi:hypothetical protein
MSFQVYLLEPTRTYCICPRINRGPSDNIRPPRLAPLDIGRPLRLERPQRCKNVVSHRERRYVRTRIRDNSIKANWNILWVALIYSARVMDSQYTLFEGGLDLLRVQCTQVR